MRKAFVFAILAITVSCEAKKIKFVPSYPYIYSLELKFREDKINDYIVDSFFATSNEESDKLLHCDIHLVDLVKAIPIKKLSISDFQNAVQELNLAYSDDDLTSLISNLNYTELKSVGFSVEKAYKSLTKTYFKGKSAELLELLKIVGIAEEFSVAYTFGTDEDMFNAIRGGNFSYDNLAQINQFITAPLSLKDLFNIIGLKKLDQQILSNFINNKFVPELIQRGLTEEGLKSFLQNLGLSVTNFKDSKGFKKCLSDFTKDSSLAVAVAQDELVTNDDSIILKYFNLEPYTNLIAKIVEGSSISYVVSADNISSNENDNIIHIKIGGPISNFIEEADGYIDSASESCKYITIFENGLSIQEASINVATDLLSMAKFFNTPFKKGSPLVCGQKLYGLASLEQFNSIIFDYVQEKQEQIPPHPLPPQIQNKPEIIEAIKEFFESIHSSLNPCEYFNCGNKEVEVASPNDLEQNEEEEDSPSHDNPDVTLSGADSTETETGTDDSNSGGAVEEEEFSPENTSKPINESTNENGDAVEKEELSQESSGKPGSESSNQDTGTVGEEEFSQENTSKPTNESTNENRDALEESSGKPGNESSNEDTGIVEEEEFSQENSNKPANDPSNEDTHADNVSESNSGNVSPNTSSQESSNSIFSEDPILERSEGNNQSKAEDTNSVVVKEDEDSSSPLSQGNEPSDQSSPIEDSDDDNSENVEKEQNDELPVSQDVELSDPLQTTEETIEENNTVTVLAEENGEDSVIPEEGENVNEFSSGGEENDTIVKILEENNM
ncbi:hypothetical protein Trydic_g5608 [Trypoxylus dichotomus]